MKTCPKCQGERTLDMPNGGYRTCPECRGYGFEREKIVFEKPLVLTKETAKELSETHNVEFMSYH